MFSTHLLELMEGPQVESTSFMLALNVHTDNRSQHTQCETHVKLFKI